MIETGYKAGDIMNVAVHKVLESNTVQDCAKIMADKKVGSLLVESNGKIVGILTEQDLARKVLGGGMDAGRTLAKDIMSQEITSIEPHKDLHDAMQLMDINEIKHLPVMSGDKLHGIVTFKDIIKVEPALIELMNFRKETGFVEN